MEREILQNVLIMLGSGAMQIVVWFYLSKFISNQIGRSTKDDYDVCIKDKIIGPAIIRAGVHLSIAWMVTSAFSRFI